MKQSTNNLLAVEVRSAERASQNCGHSNDKFQIKSFIGRIAALAICLCISGIFFSCSNGSGSVNDTFDKVEYIPFQSEKDGEWGMIGVDGKVLFEAEFKNEPTVAMNGRFLVKNSDELWEIYTAEKKPKKIGGEYLYACVFREKVTPVVRKDKAIELIDLDGKVVCTLDKVDGKRVEKVYGFVGGLAAFETEDGTGCINTSGKVVIKPQYSDMKVFPEGNVLAISNKNKNTDKPKTKYTLLNKSGKQISEFSLKGVEDIGDAFSEGLLPVKIRTEEGELQCGFINEKGEWKVKPSSKMKEVYPVHNGHFLFSDGDGWGLKNIEGETVIRAKYKTLRYASKDALVFTKGKEEMGLINLKGEEIFSGDYERIFGLYKGGYLIAKDSEGWLFLDSKGKSVSKGVEIENIGNEVGNSYVVSDYFSYDELFATIGITANSIGGLKLEMTAKEIADIVSEKAPSYNPEELASEESPVLEYSKSYAGLSIYIGVSFENPIVKYGQNAGEYEFSTEKPKIITAACTGKAEDKTDKIFAAAKDFVGKLGKYEKGNDEIAAYKLPNGKYCFVAMAGDKMVVFFLCGQEYADNFLRSVIE